MANIYIQSHVDTYLDLEQCTRAGAARPRDARTRAAASPVSRHQSRAWPFACLAFYSTDYRKKRDCSQSNTYLESPAHFKGFLEENKIQPLSIIPFNNFIKETQNGFLLHIWPLYCEKILCRKATTTTTKRNILNLLFVF